MNTNTKELNMKEMEQVNGGGIFDTTLIVPNNFRNIIKRDTVNGEKENN